MRRITWKHYFSRALRSLLKSECFGLSTSAIPHGYILARTGCPSISISSSDPMMANGSSACEESATYPRTLIVWLIHPELAVILNSLFIIFLDIVWEIVHGNVIVFNVLHDLSARKISAVSVSSLRPLTRFLNPRSSLGVNESAFPMTGMTLTRGDKRRISSMSISLRLLSS